MKSILLLVSALGCFFSSYSFAEDTLKKHPDRKDAGKRFAETSFAPPEVNLRPEFDRYNLDVRSQGKRGSCQVFAMVGVIEFHQAQRGKPLDLSEQFIMWAANQATGRKRTQGFNPDFLMAGLM